jgi:hypothetical protein
MNGYFLTLYSQYKVYYYSGRHSAPPPYNSGAPEIYSDLFQELSYAVVTADIADISVYNNLRRTRSSIRLGKSYLVRPLTQKLTQLFQNIGCRNNYPVFPPLDDAKRYTKMICYSFLGEILFFSHFLQQSVRITSRGNFITAFFCGIAF